MAPNPDSGMITTPPTLEELIRRNPELSRTDLEYLQDWMSKQPHLPKLTDEELVPFLHSNYYSLEKAKRTIENYFTIRTHAPNMFQNRDPLDPEVKKQLALNSISTLSKRDSHGYKILAAAWSNPDPTDMDFEVLMRSYIMTIDQEIRDDPTCPGYVFLLNTTGTSMGHVTKASVSAIKIYLTFVQEAAPVRIKGIHVTHCTPLMETIMRIVKPFLHGELMSLLHLHAGEMEDFYKEYPKDILPQEFGGSLGFLKAMHTDTMKKLVANRSWFLEQDKLLVDETKRPGKAKSAGEVFGLEGSFKKLDID
ncbi:clavesin-1 [Anabrus simplex]|uniref:clavesin-1 n=1 Tax=Anabrus simplex TaxID=316456 RepID=UPI0035A33685